MRQLGVTTIFLLFLFSNSFSQSLNQTIRGVVTDQDSKLPIPGATVTVTGSSPIRTVTDIEGNFRFDNVSIGRFSVQISSIGYESVNLTNIIVNSGKETVLNINMQEAVVQLNDVVVTYNRNKTEALNEWQLLVVVPYRQNKPIVMLGALMILQEYYLILPE